MFVSQILWLVSSSSSLFFLSTFELNNEEYYEKVCGILLGFITVFINNWKVRSNKYMVKSSFYASEYNCTAINANTPVC